MAKLILTALEQAVMSNMNAFGASQVIPQKMIASGTATIKSTQVSAVINNMISKGLVTRQTDLFGTNVAFTRSGKIQSTKLVKLRMAA